MLTYLLIFHSTLPRHSRYSEAVQHSRETYQKSKVLEDDDERLLKVVNEEEEK
jgi:hypothetical protein